ncbi:hypothetical protein BT69DRAFT_19227 [Atractiella rhizophila]|nr:hypothetical protein BT69DRAFT_19227 [Atractiella rhizophila]
MCMILRRFPWKLPDTKTDASYRLYVQSHPELCTKPPTTPTGTETLEVMKAPVRQGSKGSEGDSIISNSSSRTDLSRVSEFATKEAAGHIDSGYESSAGSTIGDASKNLHALERTESPGHIVIDHSTLSESITNQTTDTSVSKTSSGSETKSTKESPSTPKIDLKDPPPTSHQNSSGTLKNQAVSPSATPNSPSKSPKSNNPSALSVPASLRTDRGSVSSQATWKVGSSDSIFRLLPRETRECLSRMLTVEVSMRATLSDLLRGGEGEDVDPSRKDDWLSGLRMCVGDKGSQVQIGDADWHDHVKFSAEPPKKGKN